MSLQAETDAGRLSKRVAYFLHTNVRRRQEVAQFAENLSNFGQAAIIGGMIRDIYLDGNRYFTSDVDFVVDASSLKDFRRVMDRRGAVRNRFGGYRLSLGRWKADVWPLQLTWAGVEGHREVRCFGDLLGVTFFDWDAVLYVVPERRLLTAPGYFGRLRRRVLDINLEPNPNPLGNAVRALRYAWRWDAAFGASLAQHVLRQVRASGWDALAAYERAAFRRPILGHFDADDVLPRVAEAVRHGTADGVRPLPSSRQMRLPL